MHFLALVCKVEQRTFGRRTWVGGAALPLPSPQAPAGGTRPALLPRDSSFLLACTCSTPWLFE